MIKFLSKRSRKKRCKPIVKSNLHNIDKFLTYEKRLYASRLYGLHFLLPPTSPNRAFDTRPRKEFKLVI